jgi:menaquinol-cytochrome c reductase iron-sulfur subunit
MDDQLPAEGSSRTPHSTRRNFSVAALHGMLATILAALGLPTVAYLLVPSRIQRKDDFVEAGDVTQLVPGVPLEVAFRRNRVDGWRVVSEKSTAWVVKFPNSNVVAYAPQCTHLGCAYHWDQRKTQFICPCHNSTFSVDGRVQDGPAPRPLDRFQVKIVGNKLLLGRVQTSSSQIA